jgi:hypothetical protein
MVPGKVYPILGMLSLQPAAVVELCLTMHWMQSSVWQTVRCKCFLLLQACGDPRTSAVIHSVSEASGIAGEQDPFCDFTAAFPQPALLGACAEHLQSATVNTQTKFTH